MDDAALLARFFAAWEETDADARKAIVSECLTEHGTYADPHCPAPMVGPQALSEKLAMFSQNMPGASARPIGDTDSHNGYLRTAVLFEKDGAEMMRGQYFARREGDKLAEVIGFVGTGAPA